MPVTKATSLQDCHTSEASAEVGGQIRDHNCVNACLNLTVQESSKLKREVWDYKKADWERMRDMLDDTCWDFMYNMHPDEGAIKLTEIILEIAQGCIGKRTISETKSNHSWLNDEIISLIEEKHAAAGMDHESEAVQRCSAAIEITREEYIS